MIKRIRITGFKSLVDVNVELNPITVLIGKSGSGKTNFIQAIRWFRDCLRIRNPYHLQEVYGNWDQILWANLEPPGRFSFEFDFTIPGWADVFSYCIVYEQRDPPGRRTSNPELVNETLRVGIKTIYEQGEKTWHITPKSRNSPLPGNLMLGALTGVEESALAFRMLTNGIGCYAFSDDVLTSNSQTQQKPQEAKSILGQRLNGFVDNGENFVETFDRIQSEFTKPRPFPGIIASLRRIKPTLSTIDLEMIFHPNIVVTHKINGSLLSLPIVQESEGFRRLLATLLALHQIPSKPILIFDEPEKGIYPVGLSILAEEFQSFANQDHGQIILITHSPEFLDHFKPEQIRGVEMKNYRTHIGPISPEQIEAIKEQFLKPGELLTVDPARLPEIVSPTE